MQLICTLILIWLFIQDSIAIVNVQNSVCQTLCYVCMHTCALWFANTVKECDRMSLVTYDTHVKLVFGLTKMDETSKKRSKSFVQSIVDGSCTNLSGGLLKGDACHMHSST